MSAFDYKSSYETIRDEETFEKPDPFYWMDKIMQEAFKDYYAQVEQSCVKFCADKNVAPEDCVMLEHTSLTLIEDMGKFHFIAKYKLMTRQEYNELFNTECLP